MRQTQNKGVSKNQNPKSFQNDSEGSQLKTNEVFDKFFPNSQMFSLDETFMNEDILGSSFQTHLPDDLASVSPQNSFLFSQDCPNENTNLYLSSESIAEKNDKVHDEINSVGKVEQIIRQIERLTKSKTSDSNIISNSVPRKRGRPRIHPKKPPQKISSGQFLIGRLKSKEDLKPKATNLQQAEEIFKCQCGKQFISYMGIYRHIKSKHLFKNELKCFQVKSYKDDKTGQVIKEVLLSKFKDMKGIIPDKNWATSDSPQTQKVSMTQDKKIYCSKPKQAQISERAKQLTQKYLEKSETTKQQPQKPAIPEYQLDFLKSINSHQGQINIEKYEKVLENYKQLMDRFMLYQNESIQREEKLRQELRETVKKKQKYKMQLQMIKPQVLKVLNVKSGEDENAQNSFEKTEFHQEKEKTQFEESRKSSQECKEKGSMEVKETSDEESSSNYYVNDAQSFFPECESSFNSSIYEVQSLGLKKKQEKNEKKQKEIVSTTSQKIKIQEPTESQISKSQFTFDCDKYFATRFQEYEILREDTKKEEFTSIKIEQEEKKSGLNFNPEDDDQTVEVQPEESKNEKCNDKILIQ